MKMDRKLISMEKHEIRYARKLAKRFLEKMDGEPVSLRGVQGWRWQLASQLSPDQIERICRLLLKVTK